MWSVSTTTLQVRLRVQLNTILFAKTLIRKDIASSSASNGEATKGGSESNKKKDDDKKDDEDDFSSKAQVMTLMTTDVDRVSDFSWHIFTLFGMFDTIPLLYTVAKPTPDSPVEIAVGTFFLYKLLGVSCFYGLAVTCLFMPLNHFAGKVVVGAQDNLMKARDERVALMNEVLGGIRMLKVIVFRFIPSLFD